MRIGLLFCAGIAETIALLIWALSPVLIRLFVGDAEAIAYGVMHQRTIMPFFFLAAYTHSIAASLRGAGKASISMLGMVICWCVLRARMPTCCST